MIRSFIIPGLLLVFVAHGDPGAEDQAAMLWTQTLDNFRVIESGVDWSDADIVEIELQKLAVYEQHFAGIDQIDLEEIDSESLLSLLEATHQIQVHFPAINNDPRVDREAIDFYPRMRAALEILVRRGEATDRAVKSVQETAISTRRFADAVRLFEEHPEVDLEALPVLSGSIDPEDHRPFVWTVEPESRQLIRQPVDATEQPYWIAVISPGCGFSRAAMLALSRDPELSRQFSGRMLGLVPPLNSLFPDHTAAWNRDHPDFPMLHMHTSSDWPILSGAFSFPQFHGIRDGEVMERIDGWPLDGSNRQRLIEADRRLTDD